MLDPSLYPHPNTRKVTLHTLSFVRPLLEPGMSVLDVGCGEGWVIGELASDKHPVKGLDIVDIRRAPTDDFALYSGTTLPCPDQSFDLVMLNFVLHHLPNEEKPKLLREAMRIARKRIFVLEDTPRTPIDWLAAWLHGRKYRREIGSTADFGFYGRRQWEKIFAAEGLTVTKSVALTRFERLWWRPWARGYFVLDKSAAAAERLSA